MEESYDLEALHGLLRNEKNKFGTFNKILPPTPHGIFVGELNISS